MTKLTPRQKRFVQEYLKDQNATQAYIRVYGGSQSVGETAGPRLMGNVRVKNLVEKGLARLAQQANITAERNLKRIAHWAYEAKTKPSDSIKACDILAKILKQYNPATVVHVNAPLPSDLSLVDYKKKKKDFDSEC